MKLKTGLEGLEILYVNIFLEIRAASPFSLELNILIVVWLHPQLPTSATLAGNNL